MIDLHNFSLNIVYDYEKIIFEHQQPTHTYNNSPVKNIMFRHFCLVVLDVVSNC